MQLTNWLKGGQCILGSKLPDVSWVCGTHKPTGVQLLDSPASPNLKLES